MAWRTISIHQEFYDRIKEIQDELRKRRKGENVQLSYVTELALIVGLDNVILEEIRKEDNEKKVLSLSLGNDN